ncbi:MAG: hypothetical protein K2X87_19265 [Gemmataceae bacterium]|nr:hypothetical protein [Gemmataceae bacterium]
MTEETQHPIVFARLSPAQVDEIRTAYGPQCKSWDNASGWVVVSFPDEPTGAAAFVEWADKWAARTGEAA